MAQVCDRTGELKRVFFALCYLAKKLDDDRTDLFFFHSASAHKFKKTMPFVNILDRKRQEGTTDIEYQTSKCSPAVQGQA